MTGFSTIDSQSLIALRSERGCELIDVRTDQEILRGTIDGARHIPLHLLPQRFAEIGHDRAVVFFCQSGARSMQASAFLADRGWTEVYNLSGGITAWARLGLPIATRD